MAKRKTRSMGIAPDFVDLNSSALTLEVYENGETISRVSVELNTATAEAVAHECIRWILKRRDEMNAVLKRLGVQT